MFRVYQRTSRNTGISMPLWVAIPVYLTVGAVMLAVMIYGLMAAAVVWLVGFSVRYWRVHRAR